MNDNDPKANSGTDTDSKKNNGATADAPQEPSEAMVFILIGEARQKDEKDMRPFNCVLAAPDDDTAVKMALESLASQDYVEADLHQIGNMEGRPGDEHDDIIRQAYDAALLGEVAIIAFDGYDFSKD